jgi:anti-sigma regulatory factor (Ser/Thr protein kinase)
MTSANLWTHCRDGEPDDVMTAQWAWEPEATCVREARRRAGETLCTWGFAGEPLDDIILILSELVSNALTHGKGQIAVTLAFDPYCGTLTGAVTDAGPDWPHEQPKTPNEDGFAEHGRGLRLVETLATRWGVTRESDGTHKSVWFCRHSSSRRT